MGSMNPSNGATVYVSCFNTVLQAASALGVDRQMLIDGVGLDVASLAIPDERLPAPQFIELYQLADKAAENADLGLYVGRLIYFLGLNFTALHDNDLPQPERVLKRYT